MTASRKVGTRGDTWTTRACTCSNFWLYHSLVARARAWQCDATNFVTVGGATVVHMLPEERGCLRPDTTHMHAPPAQETPLGKKPSVLVFGGSKSHPLEFQVCPCPRLPGHEEIKC
jgi:hypothetical protein